MMKYEIRFIKLNVIKEINIKFKNSGFPAAQYRILGILLPQCKIQGTLLSKSGNGQIFKKDGMKSWEKKRKKEEKKSKARESSG